MPRSTSVQLESLLPACETQSTVALRLRDGTWNYFWTGDHEFEIDGNVYEPGLLRIGELRETQNQATNRVEVKVSNVDKAFGVHVAADVRKVELMPVTIRRFYRDLADDNITEHKHFFSGKAVNSEANESFVSFDVIPDTTAAGTCLAVETLSPNNGWRFPEVPDQSPPGSEGNSSGGIGGGTCFLKGTKILTPFGGRWAIEKIRQGWSIYSFDPVTREIFEDKVSEVFEHFVTGYFTLYFADGSQISVTPEHPFLTEDGWRSADGLKLGEKVFRFKFDCWKAAALSAIRWQRGEAVAVYNLHVKKNRTYFANGFAVHNKLDPGEILQ